MMIVGALHKYVSSILAHPHEPICESSGDAEVTYIDDMMHGIAEEY